MRTRRIVQYMAMLVAMPLCGLTLSGCLFLFGTPDSNLVRLVGYRVPHFVDATKTPQEVTLDRDCLVLYTPEDSGHTLMLLNTANGSALQIGELGSAVTLGAIFPDAQCVAFIVETSCYNDALLRVYDYARGAFTQTLTVLPRQAFPPKAPDDIEHPASMERVGNHLRVEVSSLYQRDDSSKEKKFREYAFVDGRMEETSAPPGTWDPANLSQQEIVSGYTYPLADGQKLALFTETPCSDFLPDNPKPRYCGLFVKDTRTGENRRISLDERFFLTEPYWLDGGTKVIAGAKLYATGSNAGERVLVDGEIIAIAAAE